MSYLLIAVTSLSVAGLTMIIRAAYSAPEGYEDEAGFHQTKGDQPVQHAAPGQSLFAGETTLSFR